MGNLPNWAGIMTAVIPTLLILHCYKGIAVNSKKALICGVSLLLVATGNLALMSNFQTMYEGLELASKIQHVEFVKGQYAVSLWLIMFPLIVGALGVNILTSWLQPSSNVAKT